MKRAGIFLVGALIAGPAGAQEPSRPLPSVTLPAALARVLTEYEVAWQNKDAH